MNIPSTLAPLISMAGVTHLENLISYDRRLLDEVTNLVDGAELVAFVSANLERLENTRASFESAVVRLGEKFRVHKDAQHEYHRAVALRAEGSADAKQALKLRDNLEIADQRAMIAKREFDAARSLCGGLPVNGMIHYAAQMNEAKHVIDAIESFCANQEFRPHSTSKEIDEAAWERWKALPSEQTRWEPLFLARALRNNEALFKKYEKKVWPDREDHAAPPEQLLAIYAKLREDRAMQKKFVVAQARNNLARVEAETER